MKTRSQYVRDLWPQFDALRLGMNWTEEDLEKKQILIDDVYGDSHPGSFHLNRLSEEAAIGVYEYGGKPSIFHVTDICDGWAQGHSGMNYSLPSREVITDMVEIHASVIPWDGLILVSGCDKSIPAHLKAAARINIPCIHIPGGSMLTGPSISTSAPPPPTISITPMDIRNYKLTSAPTCGACQFMGTASTMQIMSEALGMSLPGSALIPAFTSEILRLARKAGKYIMRLIENNIRPSDIMTYEAFENAIIIHAATGGSTNALLHLPAIAMELGININLSLFDEINRRTPYIANITPSGCYTSQILWYAGGVPIIQKYLSKYLHLDVLTVTGKTLRENLEELEKDGFFNRYLGFLKNFGLERSQVVIEPEKTERRGAIAILQGNLAPKGAVVKYSAVSPDMLTHRGPARVFNCEEEAYKAVIEGNIEPGSVIVIRYEGPKGSGMPELFMTTNALIQSPKLSKTALVTDGRFSGATKGPCIGHVSPEAAEGGPIAVVQDGDIIEINIPERKLNIEITDKEIEGRLLQWERPKLKAGRGVLRRYMELAGPTSKGASIEHCN